MMRNYRPNSIGLLFLSVTLSCWGTVVLCAELPDFVREDVGLCVHISDIPAWSHEIEQSESRRRLEETSFFQRWRGSQDFKGLKLMMGQIEKSLDHPLPELIRSTLGQEAILAVYPKGGEGLVGVLMTRPSHREHAQELIDLWNRLEGAKIAPVDEQYVRRTSPNGPQLYYLLRDDLFAMSDQEELIAELANLGPEGFPKPLSQSPRWTRALGSLEQSNWAVAFFQTHRWEQYLSSARGDSFEESFFRQIGRTESLIAGAEGRDGLHLRINMLYPVGSEPDRLTQHRKRHGDEPTRWRGLNSSTILMAVGRGGPDYLAEFVRSQSPKSREMLAGFEVVRGLLLGRDPFDEVLPQLGRHWQFSIDSQPERASFPWDVQLQLTLDEFSVRDSTSPNNEFVDRPSLQACLQNLVRTLIRIGGHFLSEPLASQSQSFSTTLPNQTTIDGFDTVLGLSPTVGISNHKMVVSNSRSMVERELSRSDDPANAQILSDRLAPLAENCSLGIYFNLNEFRTSLSEHAEAIFRMQNISKRIDNRARNND